MKIVMYHAYGGPEVLAVKDIEIPVLDAGEVLVKNRAASVTTADTMMRKGEPKFGRLFLGINKPKNPYVGTGFAGVIAAIGSNVTQFKVGDEVFGETLFGLSASAEYVKLHAANDVIQLKPFKLSFESAANVCDGMLTSYNFLVNLAQIESGQHVCIVGASGSLGAAAIQIAKWKNAIVTAVCSNVNADFVKELGADTVIDYKQQHFVSVGEKWDMVYDTLGVSSYEECKTVLTIKGKYVTPVLSKIVLCDSIFANRFRSRKTIFDATGMRKPAQLNAFLMALKEGLDTGVLTVPVEKTFAIEEIHKAHQHIDSGRKRGSVAVVF